MCGIVENSQRKFVIVVGGNVPEEVFDNCEYLEILQDNSLTNWKKCESTIPDIGSITEGTAVTDPESGDLLFIGGLNQETNKRQDSIIRLSISESGDWNWSISDSKLQAKRSLHTALFVPDEKLPCNNKI